MKNKAKKFVLELLLVFIAMTIGVFALISPLFELIFGCMMTIVGTSLLLFYIITAIRPTLKKYRPALLNKVTGLIAILFILIVGTLMVLNTFSTYTTSIYEKAINVDV